MAFAFSTTTVAAGTLSPGYTYEDPVTGLLTMSAETDTSSAAGTFYCGFKPRVVEVYDQTNASKFEWFDGMSAAYMFKTVTAGTFTVAATNGITVAATTSATEGNGPYAVTLGTGLHTNSSCYRIMCKK